MFSEPNCSELVNSVAVLSKGLSSAEIVSYSLSTYNCITPHVDLFYVASY